MPHKKIDSVQCPVIVLSTATENSCYVGVSVYMLLGSVSATLHSTTRDRRSQQAAELLPVAHSSPSTFHDAMADLWTHYFSAQQTCHSLLNCIIITVDMEYTAWTGELYEQ